jgi:hypothetical protein
MGFKKSLFIQDLICGGYRGQTDDLPALLRDALTN